MSETPTAWALSPPRVFEASRVLLFRAFGTSCCFWSRVFGISRCLWLLFSLAHSPSSGTSSQLATAFLSSACCCGENTAVVGRSEGWGESMSRLMYAQGRSSGGCMAVGTAFTLLILGVAVVAVCVWSFHTQIWKHTTPRHPTQHAKIHSMRHRQIIAVSLITPATTIAPLTTDHHHDIRNRDDDPYNFNSTWLRKLC